MNEPNPSGLCMCGCGGKTPIARQSSTKKGWVKGKPTRFIYHHHYGHVGRSTRRFLGPDYEVVDCGYDTPCWVWQKAVDKKGYGRGHSSTGSNLAHRIYYERHRGKVAEGLQLDHLCRNPPCVNPDHLEPVTGTENVRRGRGVKLNPEAVRAIRAMPESAVVVAEKFGVCAHTVRNIRGGRQWADVI